LAAPKGNAQKTLRQKDRGLTALCKVDYLDTEEAILYNAGESFR